MINKNAKNSKVTIRNNNQPIGRKVGSKSVSYLVQYRKRLLKNETTVNQSQNDTQNAEQQVQEENQCKERIKQQLNKKRQMKKLQPYYNAYKDDIDNDCYKIQQQCDFEKLRVTEAEDDLDRLKNQLKSLKKEVESNTSKSQLEQQLKKVQTLQSQIKQIKDQQYKDLQPLMNELNSVQQQQRQLQECWQAILMQIEEDNKNGFTEQKFNQIMLNLQKQQSQLRREIYVLEAHSEKLRNDIAEIKIIQKLDQRTHLQFLAVFNQVLLSREIQTAQKLLGKVKKINVANHRISKENLQLKKIQLQFKQDMLKKQRLTIEGLTQSIKRQSTQLLNLQFDKHFS